MDDWELTIKKADNGFIATWKEEIEEGVIKNRFEVFEDCNSEFYQQRFKTTDTERIALAKTMEYMAEHFGIKFDKYSKENLNITFDGKGHKV